MDIKKLVLKDWVQRDLIVLKQIGSNGNYADALTKPMGQQLHFRHNGFILGKHIPSFAQRMIDPNNSIHRIFDESDPLVIPKSSDKFVFSHTWGVRLRHGSSIELK